MKTAFISLLFFACSISHAGEDRSFDPYARKALDAVKAVLIEAGKCADSNDCSKKGLVFFDPATKGVSLQIYGITEPEIVQQLIATLTKQYYALPKGSFLRGKFISTTKQESLRRGMFASEPIFAELKLSAQLD